MKNYVQPGDVLTLIAPSGGVVSGTPYLIGTIFAIAAYSAAAGAEFEGKVCGVFDVPKVSAQAWTQGATIYWDDTAKLFTTVSTSNTKVGVATLAAANPSSTGRVRLNGSF